ncbi:MAG: hypothetical protein Q8873_01510 [Bacillota bacterium]|nr:hypothetical protein [Bacillota bacterium]
MNENLLILGAGQYGMVAKEISESMEYFYKIDFLDDNNEFEINSQRNTSMQFTLSGTATYGLNFLNELGKVIP